MIKNCRIIFYKTGLAKYISHLDLMRTMQRGFIRAGIGIKHTEGFNPHPYMTFALPLSVCCESKCELMDFAVTDERENLDSLPNRLTAALPSGIEIIRAYEPQEKFKEIQWIKVSGVFEYFDGIADSTLDALEELFKQNSIVVKKKTKRGIADSDIAPLIKSLSFKKSDNTIFVDTVLPAQNPSLNPEYIVAAIKTYIPEAVPQMYTFYREELYKADMEIFR